MTNYELIQKELLEMKEDLLKTETLGRKFVKFEKKFDKLFEISSFQLLNDPSDKFYGTWLINANRVKCYCINSALCHQVTNSKVNLLINPLIFCKYDNETVKLLMKHEVIHLVSEHYKRVNELSNMYLRAIPILASDLITNHILSKEIGKDLPDIFFTEKTILKLFNETITVNENSTVESLSKELYDIYLNNELFEKFINANSSGKSEEALRLLNELLLELKTNSIGEDNAVFDEDLMKSLLTSILQNNDSDDLLISNMLNHITIEAATQSRGKFPAGLASFIKAAMEPPVISWEEQLRRFIGSISAGKKPTIFRRNRRQPYRLDLKGQLNDLELDIVVAIDTSASMSDDLISKCINEIFEITKLIKTKITIIECDSRIEKVYTANSPSEVQVECLGRGKLTASL